MKIIKFIKKYGVFFYLGGAPSIVNINITMWQWWAIVIPLVFLIALHTDEKIQEYETRR